MSEIGTFFGQHPRETGSRSVMCTWSPALYAHWHTETRILLWQVNDLKSVCRDCRRRLSISRQRAILPWPAVVVVGQICATYFAHPSKAKA